MANIQVAIDGPAGSGKSSISKLIAQKIGFTHIDTGALFRTITLYALNNNITLDDESQYGFLNDIDIKFDDNSVLLNGVDVTKDIRTDIVTNNVSTVSKLKVVRDKMVEIERSAASHGCILMDGRDIGSVVLPNAQVKIFLTASASERAKRRYKELLDKGRTDLNLEDVKKDIIERDYKDSTREIAPLKQAHDAILLDTTSLSIDEVCSKIIEIINKKVGNRMMNENKEILSMEDINVEREVKVGDIVMGTVVQVDEREAYLDIKQPTEGKIFLNHFTNDKNITSFNGLIKNGDQFEVEITQITKNINKRCNDDHTVILCSRRNLIKGEEFKKLVELFENHTKFNVTVNKETEKGFFVDYNGFSLFMPKSQAVHGLKPKMDVKVVLLSVDENRLSGVVSSKEVFIEELEAAKASEFEHINEGDVVNAKVVKILPYACFLELGHLQLRLNLNEVSHLYINKIEDEIKLNDYIDVKVLSKNNGKVTVSRKALIDTPFVQYSNEHSIGETVTGKVVNKLPFGLLVELAPNVRGLLHSSEYSWNPNDNFNNCVNIDDEIEVCICGINVEKERIQLSRKALIDNPWARVEAHVGDVVSSKVTSVTDKGMEVEAFGVTGYISANEAMNRNNNSKLTDLFAEGDMVEAIVTELRPKEWVLRLSINKLARMKEKAQYEKYMSENEEEQANVTIGDLFKEYIK